jgi:hypothetical protein
MSLSITDVLNPISRSAAQPKALPNIAPMLGGSQGPIDDLNNLVAHTGLRFRLDQDAGRVVVSIIDSESGSVLRQIPSEAALRVARSLAHSGRSLLDRFS